MTRGQTLTGLALIASAAALAGVAVGAGGEGSVGAGGEGSGGEGSGGSAAAPATHAVHPGWGPHTGPVPILEYHAIQPPVAGAAYPQLFVPQADFTAQMDWLADHGYEGVTLDQVQRAWYRGGELPPKPVVVSFDDGYESQYVGAFPVLQRLGWPGLLNLKAAGSDLPDDEVRRMLDAGWELASHTINHLDLTTLDAPGLEHEVADSRRILERRFGVPVRNFCYPAGRYDDAVIAALKDAGYRGATTEVLGLADRSHPYTLDRIEIELDDGLSGFVQKLHEAGA